MKNLLCWTNATTLVRGVCTVCVVLILLGLFAPQVLLPLQPQGLSSQLALQPTPEVSIASSVSEPGASPNAARTGASGTTLDRAVMLPCACRRK